MWLLPTFHSITASSFWQIFTVNSVTCTLNTSKDYFYSSFLMKLETRHYFLMSSLVHGGFLVKIFHLHHVCFLKSPVHWHDPSLFWAGQFYSCFSATSSSFHWNSPSFVPSRSLPPPDLCEAVHFWFSAPCFCPLFANEHKRKTTSNIENNLKRIIHERVSWAVFLRSLQVNPLAKPAISGQSPPKAPQGLPDTAPVDGSQHWSSSEASAQSLSNFEPPLGDGICFFPGACHSVEAERTELVAGTRLEPKSHLKKGCFPHMWWINSDATYLSFQLLKLFLTFFSFWNQLEKQRKEVIRETDSGKCPSTSIYMNTEGRLNYRDDS